MPFFRRAEPIEPVFPAVPAERVPATRHAEVDDIDRRLAILALIPPSVRNETTRTQADLLLDRRNAIRRPRVTTPAAVPYVPGGPVR